MTAKHRQRVLKVAGTLGGVGLLTVLAFVFGAGRTAESTMRDLQDHEHRLDVVEPKVDALEKSAAGTKAALDAVKEAATRIEERQIQQGERIDRLLERLGR